MARDYWPRIYVDWRRAIRSGTVTGPAPKPSTTPTLIARVPAPDNPSAGAGSLSQREQRATARKISA